MFGRYSSRCGSPLTCDRTVNIPDHQRAGTAHAGGRRQIAAQGDVRAPQRAGEIAGHAAGNGHGIVRPMPDRRDQLRLERRSSTGSPRRGVHDADRVVLAAARDDAESALHGRQQAPPAGIIGVLAEHLDASGHEEAVKTPRRAAQPGQLGPDLGKLARSLPCVSAGLIPASIKRSPIAGSSAGKEHPRSSSEPCMRLSLIDCSPPRLLPLFVVRRRTWFTIRDSSATACGGKAR